MRNRKTALLALLAFTLAACGTLNIGMKPFNQMTPKEKSTYFMGVYNKQYADTMAMASMPNLVEQQKKVVRAKKDILTKAWPMIQAYDAIAVGGGTPSPAAEDAINNLINQLILVGATQ